MANGDFEKFRNRVLCDAALQNELITIDDRDEFVTRVVELGRLHSFKFEREDVVQAMRDARRAWIEKWI